MATVHQSDRGGGRGTTLRHVALLLMVCLPTYFIGLTDHGLTNWQESQRALVVQEMFRRGDWLLPTINEQPYLAKPPMFYWIQLVIAHARHALLGTTPGDWELRFAAALGGLLGVLATYFAARRWFSAAWGFPPARRPESTVQGADGNDRARSAALSKSYPPRSDVALPNSRDPIALHWPVIEFAPVPGRPMLPVMSARLMMACAVRVDSCP